MTDMIRRDDALALLTPAPNAKNGLWAQRLKDRHDAIAALPAVTVGVKPLVWFEVERGQNGYGKWTAEGYTVRKIEGMFLLDFAGDGKSFWRFPDADAAKAAAQRDYEARILAALEPVAAPDPALLAEAEARAVKAEAERDAANALLREARSGLCAYTGGASGACEMTISRIDAHLGAKP